MNDPTQHDEPVARLLERYDAALARLKPDYREAIIARLERGLPWSEVMDASRASVRPRMTVSRAIVRLRQEMSYKRKSWMSAHASGPMTDEPGAKAQ